MKTGSRALVGVAALVVGAVVAVLARHGRAQDERRVEVAVAPCRCSADAASVERGGYLFRSRGCGDCHGSDGAGPSSSTTARACSSARPTSRRRRAASSAGYTPVDWVRTIRHGVKPDGRPVMIMPSEEYNRFIDADLAAVVAYIRQLPAGAGEGATSACRCR